MDVQPDSVSSKAEDEVILVKKETLSSSGASKPLKIEMKIKPQSLQIFYPEIPPAKEEKSTKKRKTKKHSKSSSRTKQLLLEALNDSKQHLQMKNEVKSKKRTKKSSSKPRMTRKQRKDYELKNTISLTRFIPQSIVITTDPIKTLVRKTDQNPLLEESDLYPFTNLVEWLIWHQNFPELAYVREAYDLDAVPKDSDEIYWINVMNEPEFFTSNWKIAGSRIYDLEGIKTSGPPGGEPEFNMDLVLTENGFSTLFSDVYMILTKLPDGLKNLRYPILQLALKGLLLLELAFIDENLRWFALGSQKDLKTRLTILDTFMGEQKSKSDYEYSVSNLKDAGTWQKGILTFDLLIMKSMFLSTFSRTQISEEMKLEILKNNKFHQELISRLKSIAQLDRLRVNKLIQQISS
ncbi:MAG: hypothetical protein ACXAC6_11145 [Candidatus Hodarchaeales archaeon]